MQRRSFRKLLSGSGVGAVLARGAGGAFAVKLASVAVGLASYLILTNLLGAKIFGDYVYALSWVTVILLLALGGFDTAALRFVPSYREQSQWSHLNGFLRRSGQLVIGSAVGCAALLAGVVWLLSPRLEPSLRQTFLLASPLVVVLAALNICASQLQGLKYVVKAKFPIEVVRPLLIALLVAGLAWCGPQRVSAAAAMGANLLATTAALAGAWLLLRRAIPVEARMAEPLFETAHWFRVAMTLLLLTAFFQVLSRTDVIMLGLLRETKSAGIYAMAALASQMVFLGLSAINVIAAPMISELYWHDRHVELRRLVRLAALGVVATAFPAIILLIVFGRPILRLFGPAFVTGYAALVILCCGQLINALAGSVGFLMTMTGHQKQAAVIVAVTATLNVALNLLLIPPYGMAGAAAATAVTTAAWNLAMLAYVWTVLRINPTIVPLEWLRR